jgi:hypothetical protein
VWKRLRFASFISVSPTQIVLIGGNIPAIIFSSMMFRLSMRPFRTRVIIPAYLWVIVYCA